MWDFVCPKVYATKYLWFKGVRVYATFRRHFCPKVDAKQHSTLHLNACKEFDSKTNLLSFVLFLYLERGSPLWCYGQLSKVQGVNSDSALIAASMHLCKQKEGHISVTIDFEIFLPTGVGSLIAQRLEEQLLRWLRAAELTCDRAALLVAQDPKVDESRIVNSV